MNDRAREALIAAALNGVKQIRDKMHDGQGGYCAMGVLHVATHAGDEWAAWTCHSNVCTFEIFSRNYDIDQGELTAIIRANDTDGWDFLTIARKIGVPEEQ